MSTSVELGDHLITEMDVCGDHLIVAMYEYHITVCNHQLTCSFAPSIQCISINTSLFLWRPDCCPFFPIQQLSVSPPSIDLFSALSGDFLKSSNFDQLSLLLSMCHGMFINQHQSPFHIHQTLPLHAHYFTIPGFYLNSAPFSTTNYWNAFSILFLGKGTLKNILFKVSETIRGIFSHE